MQELFITINGREFLATYNPDSGYYEFERSAPSTGGVTTQTSHISISGAMSTRTT